MFSIHTAPSLFVFVFLLFLSSLMPSSLVAMPDCGYYKFSSAQLSRAVNELLDKAEFVLKQRQDLQQRLSSGGDITEELYQIGLIQAVAGCQHDESGHNISLLAGDPLGSKDGDGGFSLVVRGLPAKLCQAIQSESGDQRTFRVRPEVPKQAPGRVGECINNPVTGLLTLGRALPMPNTLYVYQKMQLSPPVTADEQYCPVALADQQANQDALDGPCTMVQRKKASSSEANQCTSAQLRVAAYLRRLQSEPAYQNQSAWLAEERLNTVRPLFATVFLPGNAKLAKERSDYIVSMFNRNSSNNIDAKYWSSELPTYQAIVNEIRTQSCQGRWQALWQKSGKWPKMTMRAKQIVLEDVYQAFKRAKPIHLNHFYVDTDGTLSRKYKDLNGGYIRYTDPNKGIRTPTGESLADSIVILQNGFHRTLGIPVSFRHSLEVVLEELMHAHQEELIDNYIKGEQPVSTHACIQAPLFIYNQLVYYQAGANFPDFLKFIPVSWDSYVVKRYASQPREIHAKRFAKYVAEQLLSESSPCSPQ